MSPYILITGIERSGTSYLCSKCNEFSNAIIMNEPPVKCNIYDEPYRIKEFFEYWRNQIISKKETYKMIRKDGNEVEDTMKEINNRSLKGIYDFDNENFIFGIKNPTPFLNRIPIFRQVFPECRYVACIRNPLDTCGSIYNVLNQRTSLEPINFFYYKATTSRWKDIEFINNTRNKAYKTALIWKFHSDTILENLDIFILARYHESVINVQDIINKIYKGLDLGKQLKKFTTSEIRRSSQYLNDEMKYWIEKICKENAKKLGVWNK